MPLEVIPLQTKIITPEDRLTDIIATYAGKQLRPGDTLVLGESVVAIAQGRVLRMEDVKPSIWALILARFVNQDGSLSSPYSLEVIMRECGHLRTVLAFCAAAVTHLFGRRGDFYRFAGQQASLIDDVTGNMPPFDKHIVLGPSHPELVVAEIKKQFGVNVAIVDANDLGNAQILAATPGANQKLLLKVFRANPAGNADQQTPLIIIRDTHASEQ